MSDYKIAVLENLFHIDGFVWTLVTGDAFADFLLGIPNQTQRTIPLGGDLNS